MGENTCFPNILLSKKNQKIKKKKQLQKITKQKKKLILIGNKELKKHSHKDAGKIKSNNIID